jgi:C4-dicarboxylate transporter
MVGVKLVKEISPAMVTKSPITRESAEETVKTIARGMSDVSGVTVVTNACAFYHCARGCGRAKRPAFPAPLLG